MEVMRTIILMTMTSISDYSLYQAVLEQQKAELHSRVHHWIDTILIISSSGVNGGV
jgi:hypothetical protein